MTLLLSVAIAMTAGLLMTRVVSLVKLPDVTAYLIAGILIGPFFLGRLGISGVGFVTYDEVTNLDLLSDLALGFIAFAIGSEFMLPKLKTNGKQATVVGIVQALVATIFVCAIMLAVHFVAPDKIGIPEALVLGAVASATAPAATLMVVRQYKASGPLTSILLPVVALDDAVGLVVFAVCMGVAKAFEGGSLSFISIVLNPLIEIIASLILGSVLGLILTWIEQFFHSNKNRLILVTSFVTLTTALAKMEFHIGEVEIGFSSLLVCMMLGTLFCNTCPIAEDLMDREEKWTAPLYCLFFVMSGAALRLDVFSDLFMVLIGVLFILFRSAGKYLGARWSSKAMNCDPNIQKYLGITLLPQAGVALGMSLTAAAQLGSSGGMIRSITLFSVLVYELVGPMLTKIALTKAGDIKAMPDEVKNRRQNLLDNAAKSRK